MSNANGMTLFEIAASMLIFDEGIKTEPYRDSSGHLTIGVGHKIEGNEISLSAVHEILKADIQIAEKIARRLIGNLFFEELSLPRKLALINLAFNLGEGGLAKFKETLSHFKNKDFDLAASQLLKNRYAKQVGKRADRVALMIRNDEIPKEYAQNKRFLE